MVEPNDELREAAEQRLQQQQSAPSKRPAPKTWSEYIEGVVAWLNYHWGSDRNCPYCDNPTWIIGRVAALGAAPGWPSEGELGIVGISPSVQVICVKCGHTVLVNALWIFEPQNPLPEAESQ